MATDGVKIIDGDTAFDLYATFMDAYDEGADGASLREMYQKDKQEYSFDDFEYEVFATVYALALWETGELTPGILQEVEAVISKGAGVAGWTEEVGEKAGKARQKELDKLLAKISKPNSRIRKRKKYAKVKKLIFEPGDVVTFQFPDNTYGLTVVADVIQYRSECNYMLCRTTFNSMDKPTIENLEELRIYGSLVPSGHAGVDPGLMGELGNLTDDQLTASELNRLMEQLTSSMFKLKMPWVKEIPHKALIKEEYLDNFEKVGNIPLRSNNGSSSFAISYESFCQDFYAKDSELYNQQPEMPETAQFTVSELMDQPYLD